MVLAIYTQRHGPGTWVSRRVLQDILVAKGHTPSNITRSLRSLQRRYEIELVERSSLDDTRVRPAPPAEPVPDAEVFTILREARSRGKIPRTPFGGILPVYRRCPAASNKVNK